MTYRVEQVDTKRASFGKYRYRIYKNGRLIASYWHDYRGDEHGIEFVNGTQEVGPVGRMTDFLEGGGPNPLLLSKRAVAYIEQKLL
jgi:hypothetical protein